MGNLTRKVVLGVALSSAAMLMATNASALVITLGDNSNNIGGELVSQIPGVTTIDFNGGTPAGLTGDFQIVTGDVSGQAAAPYNPFSGTDDTSPYLSVPTLGNGTKSATIALGASYNYYGLWWGSIDSLAGWGQKLDFFLGAFLVDTVTSTDLPSPGDGAQTGQDTNNYINIFTSGLFDSVVLTSTKFAFESDNHAYGTVPEPASLALMSLGLLGIGAGLRRRRIG